MPAPRKNRPLRVVAASGSHGLAAPCFASGYAMNHLGLEATLRGNLTMTCCEARHTMYIQEASFLGLHDDLAAFHAAALDPAAPWPGRP